MAPRTRAGSEAAPLATRPYLSRAAKDKPTPMTDALASKKTTPVMKRTKKATKITTTKTKKVTATKATKKGRTTTVVKEEHLEELLEQKPTTKNTKAPPPPSPPSPPVLEREREFICMFCEGSKDRSGFPPDDVFPAQCRDCARGENFDDDGLGPLTELICWDCCRDHFKVRSEDPYSHALGCPRCYREWPLSSLARFLSPQELLSAENRMSNQSLERNPSFRWCAQDTCTFGQFYDMEQVKKDPKVCCGHCERLNCFKCRTPFHEGFSCEGFTEEEKKNADVNELAKDQTDASMKAMRRNATRRCPQCMTAVEKAYGCDNIRCESKCLNADFMRTSSKLTNYIPGLTCNHAFTWSSAQLV